MLRAVISDVHGNLEALEEVLRDIGHRKVREVLFLGDAVGYGPNPNETTALLRQTCTVLLAGNHDWAATGLADIEYFNPHAQAAILWTSSVLTEENKDIIRKFPLVKSLSEEGILLVHSTPKNPEQWHYLLTYEDAKVSLGHFSERICLIGHSHMPFILERLPSGELLTHREEAALQAESRYIINVGSVGQPRDRDPRACYALIDDEGVKIQRVEYPVEKTQVKMREAGLPEFLIERLSLGM